MWEQIAALTAPDTVRAQRVLWVERMFWIPPADPDGDVEERHGEIVFNEGTVVMRMPFERRGPEVMLDTSEFLAVVRFLVEEGLLEAAGIRQDPPPSRNGDAGELCVRVKNTACASPDGRRQELERGFVDKALMDDAGWLRARYEEDGLTTAEIAGMCGVSAQTVSKRLKAAGIKVQRGRYRPAAAVREDPPEGQAD